MLGRFLTTLPLFSRLKWKQIIEKGYLKKFEFITQSQGTPLLLPEDDDIYILMNGKIWLREHNTKDVTRTEVK